MELQTLVISPPNTEQYAAELFIDGDAFLMLFVFDSNWMELVGDAE